LYELLTLQAAFDEKDRARLIQRITQDEPERPRQIDPGIPRDLEVVVLKSIAKEPSQRYGTAKDLSEDLGRFLGGQPVLARPASSWERALKWAKRRPAAAGLIGVSFFAMVVFLGGMFWYNARVRSKQLEAEANLQRACGVVNDLFTWLGEEGLASIPAMESVRRGVLEKALRFYEQLLEERREDPRVRFEAARALGRMGEVYSLLRQPGEARNAYGRAIGLLDDLVAQFPHQAGYPEERTAARNRLALLEAGLKDPLQPESLLRFKIPAEGAMPQDLAAIDLDGDGDLDLVTGNQGSNNVAILINQGRRQFAPGDSYPIGGVPWKLAVGDLETTRTIRAETGPSRRSSYRYRRT
jgi:hypothetical protein